MWFARWQGRIPGKPNRPRLFPDFPGFQEAFDCSIQMSTGWEQLLLDEEVRAITKLPAFQQRVDGAVALFKKGLGNLVDLNPRPDVAVCAIPDALLEPCGISRGGTEQVQLSSEEKRLARTIRENQGVGQQFLVPFDDDFLTVLLDHEGKGEFYKRLKIAAMSIPLPIQVAKTSAFTGSTGTQDDATRAWNMAVAMYHKGGGYPWHLSKAHAGTCYVGVSFYKDRDSNLRTSVAQLFTHTGLGLVLRGDKIQWEGDADRTPHLAEGDAKKLLSRVLKLYETHMKTPPSRLVVHKSSRFWVEELRGFREASRGIQVVDLVAFGSRGIRAFRQGTRPPLRGTVVRLSPKNYLVYTLGYVPFLKCYPGPRIPRPVEVIEHHGSSPMETVCRDILDLTKLNWNNANYASGMPITLALSDRVGEVVSELKDTDAERPEYCYYM